MENIRMTKDYMNWLKSRFNEQGELQSYKTFFTSDLHLQHNKPFLYEPRGFTNIEDHDRTIINNINEVVGPNDELYILGDLALNDIDSAVEELKQIRCKNIFIIWGNHDTNAKRTRYIAELDNLRNWYWANMIDYKKYHFYMSHWPTLTANQNDHFSESIVNLFGHTHSKELFYNDNPLMYNVSLDAHNNMPVSLDQIIDDIKLKKSSCIIYK